MLNHYAEGNCRENRIKYQHCKVLYTENAGKWYHWTSRNLKKWPLDCEINFTSTRQHLLVRTIRDQQILHSGQLLLFRKRLPAMFLFSITLSRSPLFGEELTLRLMSGKEYQSYAEIPRKGWRLRTVLQHLSGLREVSFRTSGMRRWNRLYKTISRSYTRISAGLTRYITWEAADRLSNTRNHIESLICIKGGDTHIADFPFWEKQYRYPYLFAPLSGTESSGPYCRQVYPSALRIRRTGKAISGTSGWDRPLLPCQYWLSASGAGAWQRFRPCEPSWTVRADDGACWQIVNHNER